MIYYLMGRRVELTVEEKKEFDKLHDNWIKLMNGVSPGNLSVDRNAPHYEAKQTILNFLSSKEK